ncbi:MAG TPA: outer membrane beta-barrel protein [Candidatus Limnocylindrales bacterium]|nr:outer membrane beta-barrel protein [Candidatus Limnocylindrales bacterium]
MRLKTRYVSALCTLALVGTSTMAFAGAYGEDETAVETPAAPSAPPATVTQTAAPTEIQYGMGPYVGIGYALGLDSFSPGDFIQDERASNGYNVRGGYRFLKWMAVEALWENYVEWDFDPFGHFEAWTATVNGKFIYGTHAVQPYLAVGGGLMRGQRSYRDEKGKSVDPNANRSTDRDLDFLLRGGIGADLYLTEWLAINLEAAYNLPFGELEDYDFVGMTGGLGFHF